MRIAEASFEIHTQISEGGIEELQRIEKAARTCYKSEDKISPDGESAQKLVKQLIRNGHEAMLEHSQLSVKFICDRGVSHELVRHRLASYAQESTRWCNYSQGKYGEELTFILPSFYTDIPEDVRARLLDMFLWNQEYFPEDRILPSEEITNHIRCFVRWIDSCMNAESAYMAMIRLGAAPQEARSVLPNSLKTEIVVTANYREWRNILKLRCANDAHPDMRHLMRMLCLELQQKLPIIFDDCYPDGNEVLERDESEKPVRGRYPLEQDTFLDNYLTYRKQGKSQAEIAEIMDIPVSTLRATLSHYLDEQRKGGETE